MRNPLWILAGFAVLCLMVIIGGIALSMSSDIVMAEPGPVVNYQVIPIDDGIWRINTETGYVEICLLDSNWGAQVRDKATQLGTCASLPRPKDRQ